MNKQSIYGYSDYKRYLLAVLGGTGKRNGQRAELARTIRCQAAYLSQILNGAVHLNLEQALRVNQYLAHDPDESDGFLILVQKARAGSRDLEIYFEQKWKALCSQKQDVASRLNSPSVTEEVQKKYYSRWDYIAIHMLVSIREFQTKESIAQYFRISLTRVSEVLRFLLDQGFIEEHRGRFKPGSRHLHLPESSPWIVQHHVNWRIEALSSLQHIRERKDLHYSVVYSLSREHVDLLREKIFALIKDHLALIKDSGEEVLYCNVIDFFELAK